MYNAAPYIENGSSVRCCVVIAVEEYGRLTADLTLKAELFERETRATRK